MLHKFVNYKLRLTIAIYLTIFGNVRVELLSVSSKQIGTKTSTGNNRITLTDGSDADVSEASNDGTSDSLHDFAPHIVRHPRNLTKPDTTATAINIVVSNITNTKRTIETTKDYQADIKETTHHNITDYVDALSICDRVDIENEQIRSSISVVKNKIKIMDSFSETEKREWDAAESDFRLLEHHFVAVKQIYNYNLEALLTQISMFENIVGLNSRNQSQRMFLKLQKEKFKDPSESKAGAFQASEHQMQRLGEEVESTKVEFGVRKEQLNRDIKKQKSISNRLNTLRSTNALLQIN